MDDQAVAKRKYFATLFTLSPSSDDEADYSEAALPPSFAALTACHDMGTASEDMQGGREPMESAGESAKQNGEKDGNDFRTGGPRSTGQSEAKSTAKLISYSSPAEGARAGQQNWTAVAQAVRKSGKHTAMAKSAEAERNDKGAAADLSLMAAPPRRTAVINQPLEVQRTVPAPIVPLPGLSRLPSLVRASSSTASLAAKKRKKTAKLKLQPPDKQIFKGFEFYFIPPDDIAPARRSRIRRCLEFGGTWVRDWIQDRITHIVVDKELTYGETTKFLCIADTAWPEKIILVNEDWTIDCIRYRLLVNHTQRMYQIKGYAEAREAASQAAAATTMEAGTATMGQIEEPSNCTGDEWKQPTVLGRDGKGDKGLGVQVNGRIDTRMQKKLARPGRWDYVPQPQTPVGSVATESQGRNSRVAMIAEVVGTEGQIMDCKGERGDLVKETEEELMPQRVEKVENLRGKTGEDLKRWFTAMNPEG